MKSRTEEQIRDEEDDELEELVHIEARTKEFIEDQQIKETDESSESLFSKIEKSIVGKTETVTGKIVNIQKTSDDNSIKLKVDHDNGQFFHKFCLPSEESDVDNNKLVRLMSYKNIKSNRLLDLRGETVPIEINRANPRIIVPKDKNTVSNGIFEVLQKLRKYGFIKSSLKKNKFTLTQMGFFASFVVLTPITFGIGYLAGITGTAVSTIPLLSFLSIPFMFISMIFMMGSIFLGLLSVVIMAGFSLLVIFGSLVAVFHYLREKYWPL